MVTADRYPVGTVVCVRNPEMEAGLVPGGLKGPSLSPDLLFPGRADANGRRDPCLASLWQEYAIHLIFIGSRAAVKHAHGIQQPDRYKTDTNDLLL